MATVSYLRSSDLNGLVPDAVEDGPPKLRELILNNTNMDDDAAPFISSCAELHTLELASTKITSMPTISSTSSKLIETCIATGLFPIIDACNKLEQLNLTSCRGIGVVDRRRIFEVRLLQSLVVFQDR